jgi:hypothetical protein
MSFGDALRVKSSGYSRNFPFNYKKGRVRREWLRAKEDIILSPAASTTTSFEFARRDETPV